MRDQQRSGGASEKRTFADAADPPCESFGCSMPPGKVIGPEIASETTTGCEGFGYRSPDE